MKNAAKVKIMGIAVILSMLFALLCVPTAVEAKSAVSSGSCSYVYNIANYKTVSGSCYNALHDGKYLLYKIANLDSYKIFGNGSMSL